MEMRPPVATIQTKFANKILKPPEENNEKWDLAEWLQRLTANANAATASIPYISNTVKSEGRQLKQCQK